MVMDPNTEAQRRQDEAIVRLQEKRKVRQERREGRQILLANIEKAQAALAAYDEETGDILLAFPALQAARKERRNALREYNDSIVEGAPILRNASPMPGGMTREEEDAQGRIVSAVLALGEWSELDEISG